MAGGLDGAALTELYLGEVARRGAVASDLIGRLPELKSLDHFYKGRYLSRPVFLGAGERDQLSEDLRQVRSSLVSLPDRLYGGDLATFAAAAGLTPVQVSAAVRTRSRQVTALTRSDLYREESGFRLLEVNIGSAVGGIDSSDMCAELLRHPVLAAFAGQHGLGYEDTMGRTVSMIFSETGHATTSSPVVALADWPEHYQLLEPYLRTLEPRWQSMGLDAHACHVGELRARNGRIWLRGRPVDIVYRVFLLEHLLDPAGPELMEPLLDAAARDAVTVFTPLDSELYGSKSALAMLSDEANRHLLTPGELAAIDRILPWTRMVAPGPVTLEDGTRADLFAYATSHADDLLLKPTLLHGGEGVLAGWHPTTTAQRWRDALSAAMGGPYVLQRRVRPVPELFPDDTGQLAPWIVAWGTFMMDTAFGGVFTRAMAASPDVAAIGLDLGAYVGCCLAPDAAPAA